MVVDVSARDPSTANRVVGEALRLPQVKASSRISLVPAGLDIPGRRGPANVFPLVSPDGRFGSTINGVKILQGRMYDPKVPDEIVPSFGVADELGLHVGETVRLVCCGLFGKPYRGFTPPPTTLRVVGIGAAPGMFQPLAGGYLPGVFLSPAFYRVHHDWINQKDHTAAVLLRRGLDDVQPFFAEVRRIREHLPPHSRIQVPFNQAQQTVGVQDATRAQAIALWALAGLVALAGIAVFAQSLARQTFLESTEYPTLRSVGMSPSQLVAIGMIRAGAIGGIGAAVAIVVGFLLSPLAPTGIARVAEPNPGLSFDWPVILVGALGTLLAVALLGAVPAWRASRVAGTALGTAEPARSRRPSAVASVMARSSFPPSATAGVRMALEPGRGRTAVPVRTTMFGASLSILALAAALVFGASLDRLVATPRLAGYSWDALMFPSGNGKASIAQDKRLQAYFDHSPQVAGYAIGGVDNFKVAGISVLGLYMDPRKGSVVPSIIEGRLPVGADEIVLGTETMRKLGVGIGESVPVSTKTREYRMRVVGRVTVPPLFFSFARPGQGAALSAGGAHRFYPGRPADVGGLFVKFAPGVNQKALHTTLQRRFGTIFWLPRQESTQVHNLGGIGNVPLVLAGIVALMAAATLAHTLITSIRRRRLDIAILKTLGFVRRQVSATVAWQASALGVVALLIGLPLGVISGRWGWNVFADRLGVVPAVAIPIFAIVLAVPATILVANLLAVVPGRMASRLRPGPVLRSE